MMEKLRKKLKIGMERLVYILKVYLFKEESNIEKEEVVEFCFVGSSFLECCISDLSVEVYMIVKIEFLRSLSLKGVELENEWKMYYLNGIRKGLVI